MSFRKYPMGRQKCPLKLASYAYQKDKVEYVWKDDNPISMFANLSLQLYKVETNDIGYCDAKTSTGNVFFMPLVKGVIVSIQM